MGADVEGTFTVRLGDSLVRDDVSFHSFRCKRLSVGPIRLMTKTVLDNFAPGSLDRNSGTIYIPATGEATLSFAGKVKYHHPPALTLKCGKGRGGDGMGGMRRTPSRPTSKCQSLDAVCDCQDQVSLYFEHFTVKRETYRTLLRLNMTFNATKRSIFSYTAPCLIIPSAFSLPLPLFLIIFTHYSFVRANGN